MFITLICLVKGNTTANVFAVDIDSGKLVSHLKKVIKAEKAPEFDKFPADKLKLWKVSIPAKQPSAQLTAVSKISVNIKDELGGVELFPIDDISEHFDDSSNKLIKKNLHIIVEPPTERKEVYCSAKYGRLSKKRFQWTVTREMVTLDSLKKRVYQYFTFPDGTEPEHLVISRVISGTSKRISKPKSNSSSPNQKKSDEAVIESKTIHISTDEDLASIIWTSAPKVDLEMVVDTSQQPFSWYTYSRMKTLFGLQVDDYNFLPTEYLVRKGDISDELLESVISEILRNHTASPTITSDINEATRRVFISSIIYAVVSIFGGEVKIIPEYEISGSYGKGPFDWIIKIGDIIICVTEAKKNDISHGIGQSSVQAHASMQRNRKKRTYTDADLYDEEMFCIISTGVEWIMTKVILRGNEYDENNIGVVEIRLCSPKPDPIPLMKKSLTKEDIREPVRNLLVQIKGLLEEQRDSVVSGKRRKTWKSDKSDKSNKSNIDKQ
ncbi:hypothetical protein RclHR1_02750011 [Rhizophagus clarus]|uniref:Crinkler effector protein N-terminal domain-containing protein n=1 Tax=Rhizophagus clarus TaxID=94130 RepID=A0A2Z6RFX4_9GLOM|nr:hypothetical protein RclHR1_02750011 [Rhizophagus clarus]GES97413.1 hypothetical protein GLOIN_2v1878727 [Rhizophagus clarus]